MQAHAHAALVGGGLSLYMHTWGIGKSSASMLVISTKGFCTVSGLRMAVIDTALMHVQGWYRMVVVQARLHTMPSCRCVGPYMPCIVKPCSQQMLHPLHLAVSKRARSTDHVGAAQMPGSHTSTHSETLVKPSSTARCRTARVRHPLAGTHAGRCGLLPAALLLAHAGRSTQLRTS